MTCYKNCTFFTVKYKLFFITLYVKRTFFFWMIRARSRKLTWYHFIRELMFFTRIEKANVWSLRIILFEFVEFLRNHWDFFILILKSMIFGSLSNKIGETAFRCYRIEHFRQFYSWWDKCFRHYEFQEIWRLNKNKKELLIRNSLI